MNMENSEIIIRRGVREDAPFLAETVMGALGEELCRGLGQGDLKAVDKVFSELSSMEASQYSFTNAWVAEDGRGHKLGALIAYDGARLHKLRKAFIRLANRYLGWHVTEEDAENWEDETSPDEFYIDSLYVIPEMRGHGVATALIDEVIRSNASVGKPFGILVEPDNENAYRLYRKKGFVQDGLNRFCGVPMHHLTYALQ